MCLACMTSGAIHHAVPAARPACPAPLPPRVSPWSTATPKSASLTSPALLKRMLAPLMSRCVTPWEWRYARPSRI